MRVRRVPARLPSHHCPPYISCTSQLGSCDHRLSRPGRPLLPPPCCLPPAAFPCSRGVAAGRWPVVPRRHWQHVVAFSRPRHRQLPDGCGAALLAVLSCVICMDDGDGVCVLTAIGHDREEGGIPSLADYPSHCNAPPSPPPPARVLRAHAAAVATFLFFPWEQATSR